MFDLRIDGVAARLVLNRPEARNAIPATAWTMLGDKAEEAARAGVRILVVTGEGSAFCAGADISDFAAMRDDLHKIARFRINMRSGLDRLRVLPLPTLAVIDGPCFGAGVALAMACDLRLAGSGARFAITPSRLGIAYPQEDVHHLSGLIGRGHAARLLFAGQSIDGAEAARIGLVEQFEPFGLTGAAESLEAAILANSAASIAVLKRGLHLAAAGIAQDDEQDRRFDTLFQSDETGARLAARAKGRGLA